MARGRPSGSGVDLFEHLQRGKPRSTTLHAQGQPRDEDLLARTFGLARDHRCKVVRGFAGPIEREFNLPMASTKSIFWNGVKTPRFFRDEPNATVSDETG